MRCCSGNPGSKEFPVEVHSIPTYIHSLKVPRKLVNDELIIIPGISEVVGQLSMDERLRSDSTGVRSYVALETLLT